MISRAARVGLLILGLGLAGPAVAEVPEPADYRQGDYRAEVPATLMGATVVDAKQVHAMMVKEAVVVIDVLPQPPRPAELPATTLWHPPARHDIPGSIWLANVGFGALSAEMEGYFRKALEAVSLGAKDRKLVFYCEASCWMSWNAAKRAVEYGYTAVYWFPGGMQAWSEAGYPTLLNAPVPVK
ncbi:PQQ-dependent catabolism-associated CXXCW motif protein [Dongia sp.]|uniref:PQQ-dependent catabolism-associated CXXCW motif protein n=1 Tax=Dongia sp. TaxID=1977262 RepID=UPI00375367A3